MEYYKSMDLNKKIERLRNKIEERISAKHSDKSNGLNAKELRDILSEQISKYNIILLDKVDQDTKLLNRKIAQIRITNKRVPYIDSITPTIYEDGTQELVIAFSYDGACKGIASVSKDLIVNFEFMKKGYSIPDILKLFKKNVVNFIIYFNAMDSFYHEYPGFSYVWSRSEKNLYNEDVNDGFICARFDLNNLSSTSAELTRLEDLQIARVRSVEYGELYDFIEYYNDNILSSLKVDEQSLNPLYRLMINQYRRENKGNSRRLRVK